MVNWKVYRKETDGVLEQILTQQLPLNFLFPQLLMVSKRTFCTLKQEIAGMCDLMMIQHKKILVMEDVLRNLKRMQSLSQEIDDLI